MSVIMPVTNETLVLLMDEADVFLEERTMADLQRNSLVSGMYRAEPNPTKLLTSLVFLRILESYDGILILTSNRVGSFDEAFKSRIQVALHYMPLNRQSRKQIWQNFFEMIEEENSDVDVDQFKNRLDELAKEEMNGRQIRNCLQTAQQLSKFKEEPLSWSSLSQTIKTTAKFQHYLEKIQGHNDEKWAREEQLR
jgi:AAA+ superfamily predicted ATPase